MEKDVRAKQVHERLVREAKADAAQLASEAEQLTLDMGRLSQDERIRLLGRGRYTSG